MLSEIINFLSQQSALSTLLRLIIAFGLSAIIGVLLLLVIDKFVRPNIRNWRKENPAKARTWRRFVLKNILYYWVVFFLLIFASIILRIMKIESDWILYFSMPMMLLSGVLLLAFIALGGMRFLSYNDFQNRKKRRLK